MLPERFDFFWFVPDDRSNTTSLPVFISPHPSTLSPAFLQVACMQFINIVVHSVEDMNFRVHLQYEFTKLGLEEFLQVS